MATATAKAVRVAPGASIAEVGPLVIVSGKFVWSAAGDTYATNGIVIDWSTLPNFERALASGQPFFVQVFSPTAAIGYAYDYTNKKLKIFTAPTLATEKTAAQALNATVDVVTDDPSFVAFFKEVS